MNRCLRKILVAILMIVSVNCMVAAPPLSLIQKAKSIVEETRYQLPIDLLNGLTLTQLSYDSKTYTLIYRYHYSIDITKPSAEQIKEIKLSLVHMLKANPTSDEMQFLKAGFTFYYNYYTFDGVFLYAFKITPSDINKQ